MKSLFVTVTFFFLALVAGNTAMGQNFWGPPPPQPGAYALRAAGYQYHPVPYGGIGMVPFPQNVTIGGRTTVSNVPARPYVHQERWGTGGSSAQAGDYRLSPYQGPAQSQQVAPVKGINLTGLNATGIDSTKGWKNFQYLLSQDVQLHLKNPPMMAINAHQVRVDSVLTLQGESRLGLVAVVDDKNSTPQWIFVDFNEGPARVRLAFTLTSKGLYQLVEDQSIPELGNSQQWLAPRGIYLMIASDEKIEEMAPTGLRHPDLN